MKREYMLDLETMGVAPDSAIISIGLVVMDMDMLAIRDSARWNVDLKSCVRYGLKMDPNTVMWWMGQSDEARGALHDPPPEDLEDVLADIISRFYDDDSYPTWGNGAAFDLPIFRNAFDAVGLPNPVIYHHERCYRTMKALFPEIKPPERDEKGKHNAVEDALHQARHLMLIMKHLREIQR